MKRDNIGYLDNKLTRYERTNDVMEMFQEPKSRLGGEVQEEAVKEEASICSCQ